MNTIFADLSPEEHYAVNSRMFQNWLTGINPELKLEKVTFTVIDFRSHKEPSPESVMFIRLRVTLEDDPHVHIVELRGDSVAMLIRLKCTSDGRVYTVLVQQTRLATGSAQFTEIPAGSIDNGSFIGAASREIEEELGLVFSEDELRDITGPRVDKNDGIHLSPGLLDESCRFFVAEKEVTTAEILELQGQLHGMADEGEHIKLLVVPYDDILIHCAKDAKSLLAYALYDRSPGYHDRFS